MESHDCLLCNVHENALKIHIFGFVKAFFYRVKKRVIGILRASMAALHAMNMTALVVWQSRK